MDLIKKRFFHTAAYQDSEPPSFRSWPEDKVLVSVNFFKQKAVRHDLSMSCSFEHSQIGQVNSGIFLSRLKKRRLRKYHAKFFFEDLTGMGVPRVEQVKAVKELFKVIAAAASTNNIFLCVYDITVISPPALDGSGVTIRPLLMVPPKSIPAGKSSIQGLEPVTLDDTVIRQKPECPICLEDFSAASASVKPVTALPCAHHFHVHCIVQWLEKNRLCPLCRYAMPTEDDDHSNSAR